MTNFIALYRGETVSGAHIVALSADPEIVREFAARLLDSSPRPREQPGPHDGDERRQALRVVRDGHDAHGSP
jgi:hypothetical protein